MKIVKEFPPNYKEIIKAFPAVDGNKYIIFTYGDKIYNPHDQPLRPDLMVHEGVHEKQQGTDPESWWNKYFVDEKWRLEQEADAYAAQFAFVKKYGTCKDQKNCLVSISLHLSSSMYGSIIKYHDAEKLIKNKAKSL